MICLTPIEAGVDGAHQQMGESMTFRIFSMIGASMLLVAGCASTDTEVTQSRGDQAPLPYPERILVYDFAISPGEVPADSAVAGQLSGATDDPGSNAEREALEREIAGVVAEELVAELRDLGLPAERWSGPTPQMNPGYTIEGAFLTVDEGSALTRMIIGFGVGGTELQTLVQAYQVTGAQKKFLGEANVTAESSRKPGIAATLPVGAAVSGVAVAAAVSTGVGLVTEMNSDVRDGAENTAEAIIELLEPKFEDFGWID